MVGVLTIRNDQIFYGTGIGQDGNLCTHCSGFSPKNRLRANNWEMTFVTME
jgi:hypothetical protein